MKLKPANNMHSSKSNTVLWNAIVVALLLTLLAVPAYIIGRPFVRDTPSEVVRKYYRALFDGDYRTMANYLYYPGMLSDEEHKEKKRIIAENVAETMSKTMSINSESVVSKVRILKEDINGNNAEVRVEETTRGGDVSYTTVNLIKLKNGEWKINTGIDENNPFYSVGSEYW